MCMLIFVLLYEYGMNRFSHDVAQMCSCQQIILRYSNMKYASLFYAIRLSGSKKDAPYFDPNSDLPSVR